MNVNHDWLIGSHVALSKFPRATGKKLLSCFVMLILVPTTLMKFLKVSGKTKEFRLKT
jgi:hypothetical protein